MVIWSLVKTRVEIVGGCQENESYVVTIEVLGLSDFKVVDHNRSRENQAVENTWHISAV